MTQVHPAEGDEGVGGQKKLSDALTPETMGKVCLSCTCCPMLIMAIVLLPLSFKSLDPDEQLLMDEHECGFSTALNGPGTYMLGPFHGGELRKVMRLGPSEYAIVLNQCTLSTRHEAGPGMLWMSGDEKFVEKKDKIVLQKFEYTRLRDSKGGERVVVGPVTIVPKVGEVVPMGTESMIRLESRQYALLSNKETFEARLVKGPKHFAPDAYEEVVEIKTLAVGEEWPEELADSPAGSPAGSSSAGSSAVLFASMDTDADGFISLSEFETARSSGLCE
eukprot:gnl/TRDRNA2_/TRDRNA2_170795_c0_seq3.p1 gnl/TRDRNA2_/TRDRNA2_170795_c0~~gnl/TRDRNA2_/TRDRNA2_170795_c0_seq3.p1  ORF type:complete len:277 (-),score=36.78 gnl/TRDRNA2_/TRDRNA2_170795_c0_seq3:289-1119(-)